MKVPPTQAVVIERRGQFRIVVSDGSASIVPFLDKVRARVDLREQRMDLREGVTVFFQVIDPRAAIYNVPSYLSAVEQATKAALATEPHADPRQLQWELEQQAGRWGVKINRVETGPGA